MEQEGRGMNGRGIKPERAFGLATKRHKRHKVFGS
jgi:hypothetical protein